MHFCFDKHFSKIYIFIFQNLAESEASAFELTSLEETVNDIRESLEECNKIVFQNKVEVHLRHIMTAVSQMGSLQAFNQYNGFSQLHNSNNSNL